MISKKLFLFDAYNLIFRAYYAFIKSPRFTSQGLNTSAILGFINTLMEVLEKEKPTHLAVVFDVAAQNFRQQLFPTYKAQRPATPDDIKISIPFIKNILQYYGIPILEKEGFEADDVIGTLAKKFETLDFQVFIMTTDKDYKQLVSENVFIYKPKSSGGEKEIINLETVKKEFHIENPMQVVDILALQGDSSDNIPGVPGIGEKTAINLISKFQNIENLYKNLAILPQKISENLLNSKENLLLFKKLITIVIDVPLEMKEKNLLVGEPNKEKLLEMFDFLEFKSLKTRFLSHLEKKNDLFTSQVDLFSTKTEVQLTNFNTLSHQYFLVDSFEKRKELIFNLQNSSEFAFEIMPIQENTFFTEIKAISFCFQSEKSFFVPTSQEILQEFKPIFENSEIRKISYDCKNIISVLKYNNINVQGELFDILIAHYLLHSEVSHTLNDISANYLKRNILPFVDFRNPQISSDRIKSVFCEKTDIYFQLKSIFEAELKNQNSWNLFNSVEMPLIYVLSDMEISGVKLDKEILKSFAKEIQKQLQVLENEVFTMSKTEFNLSSPKQLGEVLFEKMKIISKPKLTKTKKYSTGEEELQKIADKHPIISKILEFRSLKKLLTTYVDALPNLINLKTGKIHTSYNQAVTATGRLSSNHPNLQNIPIRTALGKEIRKSFVASNAENVLIDTDYSQIELRIIAHFCNDSEMKRAFENNEDIHIITAAKIYNVDIQNVTKEMRDKAKSANFGIIYGISSFGLSENLHISQKEAKKIIDNYFKTYPSVKNYIEKYINFASQNGFVETLLGRRRYLPDINSKNRIIKGLAERNAINSPIQGTASDVMKIAMVKVFETLKSLNLKAKMIMQVHDELVFDVPKNEVETVLPIIKSSMEDAISLNIPLKVEIGVGKNWFEAH